MVYIKIKAESEMQKLDGVKKKGGDTLRRIEEL
mgnify:CR=1 FL=1